MKTFDTISTIVRLPEKYVYEARKWKEIEGVLQEIGKERCFTAEQFDIICRGHKVTAKTVLKYVKHIESYSIVKIYDFRPWTEIDDSFEMPFTGYNKTGTQVLQDSEGVYICEVMKFYHFPTFYELSFNYLNISGSLVTEDFPPLSLDMFTRAAKKAVCAECFEDVAFNELYEKYGNNFYDFEKEVNAGEIIHEGWLDELIQDYYSDFIETLSFNIKDVVITKEVINCSYNILDCIKYGYDPEFEVNRI